MKKRKKFIKFNFTKIKRLKCKFLKKNGQVNLNYFSRKREKHNYSNKKNYTEPMKNNLVKKETHIKKDANKILRIVREEEKMRQIHM